MAASVSQTGDPFAASGSIDSERLDDGQDRTLSFDQFDASLGTLTGVTLDHDIASDLAGAFDYQQRR